MEPIVSPYGKIAPVKDMTTGLPLLQLPEGFTYQSFGWSGDLMVDGKPGPTNHDGMAVVRSRCVGGKAETDADPQPRGHCRSALRHDQAPPPSTTRAPQ